MKNNVTKGFTLIELMVVILIIGILAGISIPSFNQSMEYAREKEARVTLQLIYNAEKVYRLDKKAYTSAATTSDTAWAPLASYITNPNDTAQYYTYTVTPATSSTFTATAVRNGNASKTITIDQSGTLTPS